MRNRDLVELVRDDVLETAKKIKADKNYPSTTISYMLWLYTNKLIDDDTILVKNNIRGIRDEHDELVSFNTIQQGLLMELDKDQKPQEFLNDMKTICVSNKLYDIDKIYAYSMNNAIDLTAEQKKPSIDQYTVRSDIGATVGKATTLEEAVEVAETASTKATIVNSMGDVVETVGNSKKPIKTTEAVSLNLEAGAQINIKDINLYASSHSTAPTRLISGTYYLYDGINYFGKLAICVKPNPSSIEDILGFVNKDQL